MRGIKPKARKQNQILSAKNIRKKVTVNPTLADGGNVFG